MRRFLALGFIGGYSLWESIFEQPLLEALLLSRLVLFLLAVRERTSTRLEPSRTFVVIPIAACGGLTLTSLYRVFLVKVTHRSARENFEPPSEFWNGLDWLTTAVLVVFLVLYLRVLFLSRSDV